MVALLPDEVVEVADVVDVVARQAPHSKLRAFLRNGARFSAVTS